MHDLLGFFLISPWDTVLEYSSSAATHRTNAFLFLYPLPYGLRYLYSKAVLDIRQRQSTLSVTIKQSSMACSVAPLLPGLLPWQRRLQSKQSAKSKRE